MKSEAKMDEPMMAVSPDRVAGPQRRRIASGLEEQLRVLLVLICLAITFVVVMMSSVDRSELTESDAMSCEGARKNKCSRSDPWKWGLISSFGPVYSYRFLSASVLACQFLLFALFFGLAVYLSLCANKNHEHGPVPGKFFYMIHDVAVFFTYACMYVALVYFGFALEAFVHIKFPSYKPSTFWDENSSQIDEEPHNPPYRRFVAVCSWFNLSVAMLTLFFFATVSKVPMLTERRPQEPAPHHEEIQSAEA